ncbi:MAG: hypothetical protein IJ678_02260 [Kiritimatiellae bacterium]|nr:hypothetical protein [Kiritimatiellia bacterium]
MKKKKRKLFFLLVLAILIGRTILYGFPIPLVYIESRKGYTIVELPDAGEGADRGDSDVVFSSKCLKYIPDNPLVRLALARGIRLDPCGSATVAVPLWHRFGCDPFSYDVRNVDFDALAILSDPDSASDELLKNLPPEVVIFCREKHDEIVRTYRRGWPFDQYCRCFKFLEGIRMRKNNCTADSDS